MGGISRWWCKISLPLSRASATEEILAEYSTKNKISLIMEKKNIVIGRTELDITKNILEMLNTKIKKVELK